MEKLVLRGRQWDGKNLSEITCASSRWWPLCFSGNGRGGSWATSDEWGKRPLNTRTLRFYGMKLCIIVVKDTMICCPSHTPIHYILYFVYFLHLVLQINAIFFHCKYLIMKYIFSWKANSESPDEERLKIFYEISLANGILFSYSSGNPHQRAFAN